MKRSFLWGGLRKGMFFVLTAAFLMSGFFVAPAPAYAAHTATVTVDPTLVKGGQASTYSFNIANDSGSANFIDYLKITAPAGFSINGSVTCPTNWGTVTTGLPSFIECQGSANPAQDKRIVAGSSANVSFSATASNPGSDTVAQWTVLSEDNVFDTQTNNPVTTVDVTLPTITAITTKDTDSDGNVDTATIVFSEAVSDSTFAAGNFTIGGTAATSIDTGVTADDDTFDVVVGGGVVGTEAKQITYTQGAGADIAGNLLANVVDGTVAETDGAKPVMLSAETKTTTRIDTTWSENINGTTVNDSGTEFTVTDFAVSAADDNSDNVVELTVATMPTGATPDVTFTNSGTFRDLNGNEAFTPTTVIATDGIAPTFTAETLTTTTVQVTFSENVEGGTAANAWTIDGDAANAASDPGGTNALTLTVAAMGTGATPTVAYVAANGDIADTAGNEVADALSATAEDGVAPTVIIASIASDPTNDSPIPMTVTFSEDVTGFIEDDIVVTNGTKSGFVENSASEYSFDVTATADGLVTVAVAGAVADDMAGNGNDAAEDFTITYDNTPPTLAIVLDDIGLKAGETSLVTFTFSEAVTDFENIDITTIDNGALTPVASGDGGTTWTATFTPTADVEDPTNVITVAKTGVADLAGNAGVGTTDSGNYTIDTLRPTVTAVLTDTNLIAGETTTVTFTFSEAPTGFNEADVAVENGAITGAMIATPDPLVFTAELAPTADVEDPTNILTVGTSWADPAGNAPAGGTNSANYEVETKKPSVVLASVTADPTNGLIAVTAEFSETVTGFDDTDITVGNGVVQDFVAVDGDSYTFNVNPTDGEDVAVTIEVLADTALDAAGNNNTASDVLAYTSDTVAPTVTLTEDQADMIVRDADTVIITATFNENMNVAPTISIDVADGSDADIAAEAMSGAGMVWTYSWNVPAGHDGDATVTVAGADLAGNVYAGGDTLEFTIDNIAPVIAITAPLSGDEVNGDEVITFDNGEATAPECSVDDTVYVSCESGVTTLDDIVGSGFADLAQGAFTLYVRDTDTAGNVVTDNEAGIIKDTVAPSVTGKTPGANAVGIAPSTNITVTFSEDVVLEDADVAITPGNPAKSISFDSDTNVATIDPDGNLNDNTTYTVTLDGVTDTSGNPLPVTSWSFTTAASYSIDLTTGWNLISLPVVPTDTAASAVLGALDDAATVQSVFTYDALTDEWLVYHPDSPETSDFSTMNTGSGYWVD